MKEADLRDLDLLSLGCWDKERQEKRKKGGTEGRRETKRTHIVGTAECTFRKGQSYAW